MWSFDTDDAYTRQLSWAERFVREYVAELDACHGNPYDKSDTTAMQRFRELRAAVRRQGLWAVHLPDQRGGQGRSRLERALLDEVLGPSRWAPTVFGYDPHSSVLASIVERFGTDEHRRAYVDSLLEGELVGCYSVNEPIVGGTKSLFRTRAERDGRGWVINGEKWFNANARYAAFFVVVAVTDPSVSPKEGMSVYLVRATTPGVSVVRDASIGGLGLEDGCYGYVRYEDVRVPADSLLGDEGAAHVVVDAGDDPLDLHYAARGVGQLRAAFDMMCERAVSAEVRAGRLRDLQITQERIADSWIELHQFRLLVRQAAWAADNLDPRIASRYVCAAKAALPDALRRVVGRAMHLHGVFGVSSELPFHRWMAWAEAIAVADGPTEMHKQALSELILDDYAPTTGAWPTGHLPTERDRWRASRDAGSGDDDEP